MKQDTAIRQLSLLPQLVLTALMQQIATLSMSILNVPQMELKLVFALPLQLVMHVSLPMLRLNAIQDNIATQLRYVLTPAQELPAPKPMKFAKQ